MGIYIKNMEMPKDGAFVEVVIWSDGHVTKTGDSYLAEDGKHYYKPCDFEYFSAVELPPHGRLIDADAFDERVRIAGGMADEELTDDFKDGIQTTLLMLKTQKSIIEAEEVEE